MKKGFYVVGLFFILRASFSYGEEVIGYPGRIEGRCEVIRNGVSLKITPSTAFIKGDLIRTYNNGRVEVVLLDETVIKIGPDAEVNISDFLLDEEFSKRRGILKLIRGSIMTILRKVYKGIKGEFSVETNTAVVGVRGTKFIVSAYSPSQTEIIVLEDSIYVDTPLGSIVLEEGYITSVFEGQPPSPPQRFDPEKIMKFIEGIEPSHEGHEEFEEKWEGFLPEGEERTIATPEEFYHRPPVEQTVQTGGQDVFQELGEIPVKVRVIFP